MSSQSITTPLSNGAVQISLLTFNPQGYCIQSIIDTTVDGILVDKRVSYNSYNSNYTVETSNWTDVNYLNNTNIQGTTISILN